MFLPIELKNIIEDLAGKFPQKELKECASKLSDRYLNESRNGVSLASREIDILTYAVMRMPATFGAISSVLSQLDLSNVQTVLDVGAGMGTATFACYFSSLKNASYTCIEKEHSMINLGNKLFSYYPDINVKYLQADYSNDLPSEKYDLVVVGYSLNELTDEDRRQVVDSLWKITNKYLVIVEPGTPVVSLEIRAIRKQLLGVGAHIVAPCTHSEKCPIKGDDWCHFVTRVERSKLHKYLKGADVPFEDEKYSYIVVSKDKVNNPLDYRVMRHPVIGKGNIALTVCSKNGIETKRYFKSHPKFKELKKIKAGDSYKE